MGYDIYRDTAQKFIVINPLLVIMHMHICRRSEPHTSDDNQDFSVYDLGCSFTPHR